MDHTAFARAIEELADKLRGDPTVLMVGDDYDDQGAPRILVLVRDDVKEPLSIPESFGGFAVHLQRGAEIVPHQ